MGGRASCSGTRRPGPSGFSRGFEARESSDVVAPVSGPWKISDPGSHPARGPSSSVWETALPVSARHAGPAVFSRLVPASGSPNPSSTGILPPAGVKAFVSLPRRVESSPPPTILLAAVKGSIFTLDSRKLKVKVRGVGGGVVCVAEISVSLTSVYPDFIILRQWNK